MPGEPVLEAATNWLGFEIPADFRAIKNVDVDLALRWRHISREIFERYFAASYRVVGFRTFVEGDRRCSYYILHNAWTGV
jgi:predicted GNAT superfamily acetyltransferase